MSSTDGNSTDEKKVREVFTRKLVPAAEKLRARGVSFFALAPGGEAESWYVDGPRDEPEFVEVEAEDCERALRELWEGEGLPELASMAGDLVKLARDIEFDDDQSAEVSPFVYVMY